MTAGLRLYVVTAGLLAPVLQADGATLIAETAKLIGNTLDALMRTP